MHYLLQKLKQLSLILLNYLRLTKFIAKHNLKPSIYDLYAKD